MTLQFLSVPANGAPPARSPMEPQTRAAGARFETRDGWSVGVAYASPEEDRERAARTVGFADVSHLGKLAVAARPDDLADIVAELTDGCALEPRIALRSEGAWWCPVTRERMVVVCDGDRTASLRRRLEEVAAGARGHASVLDVTSVHGALTIVGPLARETLARFCALDLRPHVTPVRAFRPGSVARTPGMLVREHEQRYLFWFGAALGQYMWTVVADAATHLGGAPIGTHALQALPAPQERAHA